MICIICKSKNVDSLFEFGEYPYFTVPIDKADKDIILNKYSQEELFSYLNYNACSDCGHVFINQIPDQNYFRYLKILKLIYFLLIEL